MKNALTKGIGFGLTSGVITTLGMIVGMNSGTHSRILVIGAIITIAIADALSDALGMHISTEAENRYTNNELWTATFSTFLAKLVIALSFLLPVLLFPLNYAVFINILWGIILLTIFSYYTAIIQKARPLSTILEHLLISFIVILATHFIGVWINKFLV